MSNLSSIPEESANKLVEQLIAAHGEKAALRSLARMSGYVDAPPTIGEFIEDPEYLGGMIGFDEENKRQRMFPFWRASLEEIYPNPFYSPYLEIIATGAIGQGKSTFSMAGVMYDMAKLLMVKKPHSKYGLIRSDQIVLALVNRTVGLANDVLLGQIITWMNESPFFKRHMKIAESMGSRSILPNNIQIAMGSRPGQFVGKAIFSTILSEINFQNTVADQAAENYNGIRQRVRSRFQTSHSYPGRMWIDSSKTDSGSFIDEYLLKDRDPEDLKQIRVFDNPRWKVLPPWKLPLSGETFKVFVGDQTKDPFIVDRPSQIIGIDEAYVMDVPVEFAGDFRLDLYKALQDVAGVSTQAAHKFISSTEKIQEALTHDNPITREVCSVDMYKDDERLIDFIDFSKITVDRRPRFIHIDLGIVKDKTAIASTRLDGMLTTRQWDAALQKHVVINEPVFHTDFIMFVESKAGQEVPIRKIKNLMIDLRARKYPIVMVSTDGYQSTNLRQDLQYESFATALQSVDRSFDPYIEFKNAILSSRWHGPKHPILAEEIRNLETRPGKIDHPINGSKDGTDAVCGSIYTAKLNMAKFSANTTTTDIMTAIMAQTEPTNTYEQVLGRRV